MKYIVMAFILVIFIYSLSFVKYNWKKKNKMAAVGVILLSMVSVVLPVILLYRK